MKNILLSLFSVLAISPALITSIVPPNADTPEFYLVASSESSSTNLLPLRLSGGTTGGPSLSGTGPIGVFYFYQGLLVAVNPSYPSDPIPTLHPIISSDLTGTGCTTYGGLAFIEGSSTNKCARSDSFYIHSNEENSQLGANLVFNWVGGFFACGDGLDIWYKVSPTDGPAGLTCTPIDLYTVPVVA